MDNLIAHINPLGRPPKFKTAEELWSKFIGYVELMNNTPIKVNQFTKQKGGKQNNGGDVGMNMVQHPLTLVGFRLFAGISDWSMFKQTKKYQTKEFLVVIRAIEDTIREHQVGGAMVNLYNSNLVARLNGIADKTEMTGKDGEPIRVDVKEMSDEEIRNEIMRLRKSMENS